MRDRCEASGLRVKPNVDGRAHCPLCGDDWHCLTKYGRLRQHQRIHAATAEQLAMVAREFEYQRRDANAAWPGLPMRAPG